MLKNISYTNTTIGEIVASDFRVAEIFKNAGIDFCCGGKQSLDEACREKSLDLPLLIKKITELENSSKSQSQNFNEWDLSFLADYIVNTHHKYVLKTLPELMFYTQKITSVHGSSHPELFEVEDLFRKINKELLQHLQKEEALLFPLIKEVIENKSLTGKETIKSEISRMVIEHEFAGGAMDKINVITGQYMVPDDGCNTYHVTFKMLKQFEDDLHIHVHLENNILYPKALLL